MKGMNCHTEMYSALSAEVPIPDDPATHLNTKLIETLASADRVNRYILKLSLMETTLLTFRNSIQYFFEDYRWWPGEITLCEFYRSRFGRQLAF